MSNASAAPAPAEVEALAAIIAPYLPAAIERFGSFEVAVDKLVALHATDAR